MFKLQKEAGAASCDKGQPGRCTRHSLHVSSPNNVYPARTPDLPSMQHPVLAGAALSYACHALHVGICSTWPRVPTLSVQRRHTGVLYCGSRMSRTSPDVYAKCTGAVDVCSCGRQLLTGLSSDAMTPQFVEKTKTASNLCDRIGSQGRSPVLHATASHPANWSGPSHGAPWTACMASV